MGFVTVSGDALDWICTGGATDALAGAGTVAKDGREELDDVGVGTCWTPEFIGAGTMGYCVGASKGGKDFERN